MKLFTTHNESLSGNDGNSGKIERLFEMMTDFYFHNNNMYCLLPTFKFIQLKKSLCLFGVICDGSVDNGSRFVSKLLDGSVP